MERVLALTLGLAVACAVGCAQRPAPIAATPAAPPPPPAPVSPPKVPAVIETETFRLEILGVRRCYDFAPSDTETVGAEVLFENKGDENLVWIDTNQTTLKDERDYVFPRALVVLTTLPNKCFPLVGTYGDVSAKPHERVRGFIAPFEIRVDSKTMRLATKIGTLLPIATRMTHKGPDPVFTIVQSPQRD